MWFMKLLAVILEDGSPGSPALTFPPAFARMGKPEMMGYAFWENLLTAWHKDPIVMCQRVKGKGRVGREVTEN